MTTTAKETSTKNPPKTQERPLSVWDIIMLSECYEPEHYGDRDYDKNFLLQIRKDTAEAIAFKAFNAIRNADAESNLRRPDLEKIERFEREAEDWASDLKCFVNSFYATGYAPNVERVGISILQNQEIPTIATPKGSDVKEMSKETRTEMLNQYTELGVDLAVAEQCVKYGVPRNLVESYRDAQMDVRQLVTMEKQVLQRQLKMNAARVKAAAAIEDKYLDCLVNAAEWAELRDEEAIEEMIIDRLDNLETRLYSPQMHASATIKDWLPTLEEAQAVVSDWMKQLRASQKKVARNRKEKEATTNPVKEGEMH